LKSEPASNLKSVGGTPVIQIVTETGDQHCQDFNVRHVLGNVDRFAERVEKVTDTEGVHPVMVGRVSVSEIWKSGKWCIVKL
jgi:hypothetical protein